MSKFYPKNKQEIAYMRKAGEILQAAQKAMKTEIKAGVTLLELDEIAEKTILSMGGQPGFKGYGGFPRTICTMLNSEIVHGIPDNRTLKDGDLISIDCGVLWHKLNADAAFTVIVGGDEKNPERAKFSNTVKKALEAGCKAAKIGNRIGDIGYAIEQVINKSPYSLVREYTGHGVGYELHEDPHVFNYGKPNTREKIVEGMTLAIEPIVTYGSPKNKTLKDKWTVVTLDGKDACQWEHFGVATPNGLDIFA